MLAERAIRLDVRRGTFGLVATWVPQNLNYEGGMMSRAGRRRLKGRPYVVVFLRGLWVLSFLS